MKFWYFLNLLFLSNCIIKFHFKKKYKPSDINEKFDYYQYLTNNDLITEISIGTPPQKIPVTINYYSEPFYLTKPSSQGKFSHEQSKTFYSNFTEVQFSKMKGYIAKDSINLNFQNEKKNKEELIEDISFSYIIEPNASKINFGSIGLTFLSYSNFKDLNLVFQLKKKELIENYGFQFIYLNDIEGDVYLGQYPHEYNKSYYDNIDFFHIKVSVPGVWSSTFQNVSYGNEVISQENHFTLNNTLGGIIGNRFLFVLINKYFFNNPDITKGKCKTVYQYEYNFFECESDVDIKQFQNLQFYSKELNYTFVLTYEDLFEVINGKIYCKLIFKNEMSSAWYLGQPFLKKYLITFDQDKKLFGFYKKLKDKKSFFTLSTFFVFVLIIVISILIVVLFKYINKKPRKIRANELEENIDYAPFK